MLGVFSILTHYNVCCGSLVDGCTVQCNRMHYLPLCAAGSSTRRVNFADVKQPQTLFVEGSFGRKTSNVYIARNRVTSIDCLPHDTVS